jgi:hypothetical protein
MKSATDVYTHSQNCIPPQSRYFGSFCEVALLLWTSRRLGLQTGCSKTCDLRPCVMRSFCKKDTNASPMAYPKLLFSNAVCNLKWGHFWNMGHFGYTNPICVLISQVFTGPSCFFQRSFALWNEDTFDTWTLPTKSVIILQVLLYS